VLSSVSSRPNVALKSPIEQRMWEILDEAGLASQFVMQEPIEVEYLSQRQIDAWHDEAGHKLRDAASCDLL
jgi:hypothetical protein